VLAGVAALLVFSIRGDLRGPGAWSIALAIPFAPIYFLGRWVLGPASAVLGIPYWLLIISASAVGGTMSHPFVPWPAAGLLAIVGFSLWALCMLFATASMI